jgi:broad specificity phosphatase PhoE
MKAEIWVVRHGQTVSNLENRWQGATDSPLTEFGRQQARDVAIRLLEKDFGGVFDCALVSPLGRARQTFTEMQSVLGPLEMNLDARIQERDVGVLAGHLTADLPRLFPAEVRERLERPMEWHPEGGESSLQFVRRVRAIVAEWHRTYAGKRVLVVTHGGVCAQIHTAMLEMDPVQGWELKIPNGCLSCYQYLTQEAEPLAKSDLIQRVQAPKWICFETDISLRDASMNWFPS